MGTGTITSAVASASPATPAPTTSTLAAMTASAATAAATAIIPIVRREATAAAARPTTGQGANAASRMARRGVAAATGCEDA